jgi:hypothetical protein
MTAEGCIKADILAIFDARHGFDGIRLWRQQSGVFRGAGGSVRAGIPGMADLGGWKRQRLMDSDGRVRLVAQAIQIEVKVPGEHATEQQAEWIRVALAEGCLAGVVHSLDEASQLLGLKAIAAAPRVPLRLPSSRGGTRQRQGTRT